MKEGGGNQLDTCCFFRPEGPATPPSVGVFPLAPVRLGPRRAESERIDSRERETTPECTYSYIEKSMAL